MGHDSEPGDAVRPLTAMMLVLLGGPALAEPPRKPANEELSLDFLEFLAEFADEDGNVELPEADMPDAELNEAELAPDRAAKPLPSGSKSTTTTPSAASDKPAVSQDKHDKKVLP
ncbi:hypothetical protein EV696_103112 [Permianibacter aggregans]|uniref:Uncharacterized protein n=1 Tax=Permianibacter aggregans TaxID=1510150 RepID=A0A4R6UV98_9GAMM|nr:hypothetical protein EV696_103112 [Permianibacter aggregans]